jgi:hypothetical protein
MSGRSVTILIVRGVTSKVNFLCLLWSMPNGLRRYYGAKHLHFITGSCHRRQAFLNTGKRRDLFLAILEQGEAGAVRVNAQEWGGENQTLSGREV